MPFVFCCVEEAMRFRSTVVLAIGALILQSPAVAQSPPTAQGPRERVDTEVVNKIKEEGLKRSKVMETISYLTDVHGPRLTASPRTRKAGEWTQGTLKEW